MVTKVNVRLGAVTPNVVQPNTSDTGTVFVVPEPTLAPVLAIFFHVSLAMS